MDPGICEGNIKQMSDHMWPPFLGPFLCHTGLLRPCCHWICWTISTDIFWCFSINGRSHHYWISVKPFCKCQLRSPSTTITDVPLPSYHSCLLIAGMVFGILFFIMVPVDGKPFESNTSIRVIVVKYWSKKTQVAWWERLSQSQHCYSSNSQLLPLNVFFPWYTPKSCTKIFGESRRKIFRPVGVDLPGTYGLTSSDGQ